MKQDYYNFRVVYWYFCRFLIFKNDPLDPYPQIDVHILEEVKKVIESKRSAADLIRLRYISLDDRNFFNNLLVPEIHIVQHQSHVIRPVSAWHPGHMSKSSRRNLSRGHSRLSRLGSLKFIEIQGDSEIKNATESLINLKSQWLRKNKKRALGFNNPVFRNQIADQNYLNDKYHRRMFTLQLNDQVIAYELCLQQDKKLLSFMCGFDPQFAKCSPGRQLSVAIIARASELGCGTYDLLPPASAFKSSIAKQTDSYCEIFIPLTTWGRMFLKIYKWGTKQRFF